MNDRIETITKEDLTSLLQRALGDASVEIANWSREPVSGGFGGAIGGTAIYLFSIQTRDDLRWSLILKILYQRPQEDQRSPYYWKREFEVYRSDLLDRLPSASFSAPKIYGLTDYGDCCWIWMEDIVDLKGAWALADYHNIAVHLGRFNGAYLLANSLPDYAWLTRYWHCAIVPALAETFADLNDLLDHPLVRRCLPAESQPEIESIWRNRQRYIEALQRLPQTFCHIDAFRRNILHRHNDIVLLDWAMAGSAAIGEDLVSLVAVSLHYSGFSQSYASQLDATVFDGYLKGLRQAGWQGDAKLARTGFTCAMVLRGLAGVKQDINLLIDPANHESLMQIHQGASIEKVADFFADIRRFRLLRMAEEAETLLNP